MTPRNTPRAKPIRVSSNVTAICSHNGPCAVPCVAHVTSCAQIPEGWPQKNGSIMPTRVPNSQPPIITTRNRTRRALIRMRRRRAADEYDFCSGGRTILAVSLLIALIADNYLVAKIFPDFMIELNKAWIEADFRRVARARQVDGVDTFHGCRACREHTDLVGQRDCLLQVVSDKDNRGRA